MQRVEGVVTLVQEDRFQLRSTDGRNYLFILSHSSPLGVRDLPAIHRSGATVSVRYGDDAGIIGHVAYDIAELEQRAAA